MATRLRSKNDLRGERTWLGKIEAADRSADRKDAARASWRQVEIRVTDQLLRESRKAAVAHLRKYPGAPMQALAVLAATGADRKTLESEYKRVIDATRDPGMLNQLVYNALGAGALDAALLAADKQVKLDPDNPNAYDSLAEVHNYRKDKVKALATARLGLGKKPEAAMAAAMKENMARFESGGPTGDARPPGSLERVFEPRNLFGAAVGDAASITEHMFDSEKHAVTKACSGKARALKSALVRVTIGKGAVLSKVEVLEPDASSALKKCVVEAVRAIKIPADNPAVRVVIEVPFEAQPAAPSKPAVTPRKGT
jgi:tetratricopeptide (TPR) repeat protein